MSQGDPFPDLIQRVRAGDSDAIAQLVRDYEPEVRRVVHINLRMRNVRVRQQLNESDVCQSVLASFFVRAALGQYDLGTPEQLSKLLSQMARNKLNMGVNKAQAARRDIRRNEAGGLEDRELEARGASPSEEVVLQEQIRKMRELLSPEERKLAELRTKGLSWETIASELGGKAEALRKKLDRARERLEQHMGLRS
jgi:RNA polymerase sigma factor (sigma-70 family)